MRLLSPLGLVAEHLHLVRNDSVTAAELERTHHKDGALPGDPALIYEDVRRTMQDREVGAC